MYISPFLNSSVAIPIIQKRHQATTLRSVSQNGWIPDGSWPANACRLEQIGRRMHPWQNSKRGAKRIVHASFLEAEIDVKIWWTCDAAYVHLSRVKQCHVGFGWSLRMTRMTDRNRLQPVVSCCVRIHHHFLSWSGIDMHRQPKDWQTLNWLLVSTHPQNHKIFINLDHHQFGWGRE